MNAVENDGTDEFRIVTCADSNFFRFLPTLERNIYRRYGCYPIIYDLGLKASQIRKLKSDVRRVAVNQTFQSFTSSGEIRATHKPNCLLHFLETNSENCLYVDADTYFIEYVGAAVFASADVAVTPRHPRELLSANPFKNGKINTGVIFFRNTPAVRELIKDWQHACAENNVSDQLAMSNLLEDADLTNGLGPVLVNGLNIEKLDPVIYNDTGCSQGHIWHFKNAGRRFHKLRRRALIGIFEDISPKGFQAYARRKARKSATTSNKSQDRKQTSPRARSGGSGHSKDVR